MAGIMGHSRLGNLPRTRKWQEVVGLIAIGASFDQIANAVVRAAENGLMATAHHQGLVEAFWALTKLAAAARDADFVEGLRSRGLDVPDHPSLPSILAAVSESIDAGMPNNRGRTDLGEIAQSAAAEAVNSLVTEKTQQHSLFSTTVVDVQRAFHELGTPKNFGELGRRFFGQVMNKVLQFYVSREAGNHVGENQRFANLADKAEFDRALANHCREASVIVARFAGEWRSAHAWNSGVGGITREEASGFAHVAMKKIVAELKEGAK
ncbi:MAG: hypothetical protein AAFZ67_11470 [Planctomycetota bacterium]